MVSPGLSSANIAAALACAPECGWTFAASAPNSALTRSMAICSIDVDVLAAAVVAAARVALGVLVGQDRALGLHDGDRSEVLRGDHLQGGLLAVQLGVDGGGDVRVELVERGC